MNDIHGHEADIVPVARIRLAGIGQPGDQKGNLDHKENEISELRNRKAEKIASGCRIPRSDYFFSGPLPAAAGAWPAGAAGALPAAAAGPLPPAAGAAPGAGAGPGAAATGPCHAAD